MQGWLGLDCSGLLRMAYAGFLRATGGNWQGRQYSRLLRQGKLHKGNIGINGGGDY